MADKKVEGKESVRLATNTNAIANLQETPLIIDSVSIAEGDRILVKNKASIDGIEVPSEVRNGIYVVRKISGGSASLIRSKDANTSKEVNSAMFTFVQEGASNKDDGYILTTINPIELDTTPLIFKKFTDSGQIASNIQESINANADNIALLAFRNQTQDSLTLQKMVEGIVDEYENEDNIDNIASIDEIYDANDDFYTTENDLVKLLLHLNGTNGSTTIVDSSPTGYNVTANGDAQLDTSDKQFGSASLLLDAIGDYLSVPDDPDWDIFASATGDYTLDFWVNHNSVTGNQHYFNQRQDSTNQWFIRNDTVSGKLQLNVSSGGVTIIGQLGITALTAGVWHHVAIIKKGDEYAIYLDGVQESYTQTSSTLNASGLLLIGAEGTAGSPTSFMNGNMDECRIQKSNVFGASPNVGLTDTITVPTSESGSTTVNTTLISEGFTAVSQPDDGRNVIFIEEVDALVLNTDIKAFISRDDGTTYSEITLVNRGEYQNGKNILAGSVDISSQPAGTTMRYKIQTFNNKNLKIHGNGLSWK